jgi:hypothetical protein
MGLKRIFLGTDVATFVLFHPDDLAHRADDPIAWYSFGAGACVRRMGRTG